MESICSAASTAPRSLRPIGSRATARVLLAGLLISFSSISWAALGATPKRAVDLSGFWRLNDQQSDDPEQMLQTRLEQERKRLMQERRREELMTPEARVRRADADFQPPVGPQRPWQKRREDELRRMLNITRTLQIRQEGRQIQMTSDLQSQSYTAGERSQVSMPQGELADSNVGWDGEWFVVQRNVRGGPRVVEKFRLLKTGQLDYRMSWRGETELAGMNVRRIFDRSAGAAATPSPDVGPVK